MHRSDYMADTASGKLLQIELNTISTSFPGLSSRVTDLHKSASALISNRKYVVKFLSLKLDPALRFILDKHSKTFGVLGTENIPDNSSAESMAEALALAWKEAGDDA